ncbi:hypothetical protein [Bacillus sp. PS06]|uniref:UPF0738 family protein n=1 Tax=Bacillus sp. PS06 TaxID=2764176 RepID=UPI00177E5EFE|nr:hypothetical protein [Bacillus sp. PS06]MBD8067509.1 hypothetical protein [Bacillus sp. PS06]
MQKKIEVTSAIINENRVEFQVGEAQIELTKIKATGQMLVDSDALSFIYIAENDSEYVYLSFPITVWKELQEMIEKNYIPVLVDGKDKLTLENMTEELTYLIGNIEGNANYGDEMVEKVENIFLKQSS